VNLGEKEINVLRDEKEIPSGIDDSENVERKSVGFFNGATSTTSYTVNEKGSYRTGGKVALISVIDRAGKMWPDPCPVLWGRTQRKKRGCCF